MSMTQSWPFDEHNNRSPGILVPSTPFSNSFQKLQKLLHLSNKTSLQ